VGFAPYKGMTKTLRSFLISAALSIPALAQTAAPHYNGYLDEIFFPRLKTKTQVEELVKKAGFTPVSQTFEAKLPTCEIQVAYALSDDGNDLILILKLGALANEQAAAFDNLSAQFREYKPAQLKFRSQLYTSRVDRDNVALGLIVLIPNRGATPEELKQAVSELARTAEATMVIWGFWIKR